MIAFLTNLDNFGIPAFLGIPANITVLSTAIYQEVIGFGPSAFARAATLSVILVIIALLGTGIQWLLVRKAKVTETASWNMIHRASNWERVENGWSVSCRILLSESASFH